MPVIWRPTPDDRIEAQYQVASRGLLVGLHAGSTFLQEGFHVLLGGLGQVRAAVFPDMLAETVEPLVDMGDVGFLGREWETTFTQKHFHQRFDFRFQQLFAAAGANEVIRPSHHLDHAVADFGSTETPLEALLESIERQIHQDR
jgi:hypothetical protein